MPISGRSVALVCGLLPRFAPIYSFCRGLAYHLINNSIPPLTAFVFHNVVFVPAGRLSVCAKVDYFLRPFVFFVLLFTAAYNCLTLISSRISPCCVPGK